ncbi:hypothetical protein ACQP00_19035 [Dactylosporangium sp. CS-047395]|uniref:hypothetical protein n=1 Tax=Dactylosporangium sp. CS-047395 TaxID=3239936 RepID=UPI003D909894
MTESEATNVDDPIQRADEEFEQLKKESEERADRTAQVERELDGDEDLPDRD